MDSKCDRRRGKTDISIFAFHRTKNVQVQGWIALGSQAVDCVVCRRLLLMCVLVPVPMSWSGSVSLPLSLALSLYLAPVCLVLSTWTLCLSPACLHPVCLDPVCRDSVCLDPVSTAPVCLDPICLDSVSGWLKATSVGPDGFVVTAELIRIIDERSEQ